MGMFDMFEAALEQGINDTVASQVTISTRLLDERITALESGRVQSTFTGDVANALTEEQREAVVRIIDEAVDTNDFVREDAVERTVSDIIDHYMEYEVDIDSKISEALENSFDPSDYDILTRDNFEVSEWDLVDTEKLEEEISGVNSRLDDLESLSEAVDALKDAAGCDSGVDANALQDTISDIESRLTEVENRLETIESAINSFAV